MPYLLAFLDAFDFANDSDEELVSQSKSLISASVLGLIFEKINGYKDGSFYTPSFITMYMARETITKTIIDKFNQANSWQCKTLQDIGIELKGIHPPSSRIESANEIINSIKICDPAVGSGHFLVSALNEILRIKSELSVLVCEAGNLINHSISIENDELIIKDDQGELFEYKKNHGEKTRIQKTLFKEKQLLIENCLFGVDINPNSVNICRLRLWIELLKNAYYKVEDGQLDTLPNIDINIKCGNSLISRFGLADDLSSKDIKNEINHYKQIVKQYKENIGSKRDVMQSIDAMKAKFEEKLKSGHAVTREFNKTLSEYVREYDYESLNKELAFIAFNLNLPRATHDMFGKVQDEKTKTKKRAEVETALLKAKEIESGAIYKNAFEWRFEFPEVLNEEGDFVGFDVVIGNPPYIKEYEGKEIFDGLRNNEIYQGKMDIWYMFGANGINLLKENGYLNYIAPNNWVTNAGASKFRNFILQNAKIEELIDFRNFMVFESASIQTMIMLFNKVKEKEYSFDLKSILNAKPELTDAIDVINGVHNHTNEILKPHIKIEELIDKNLTFSKQDYDLILKKMVDKLNFNFEENEIANGIHPHHDFVNKKIASDLGDAFKVGDGIFGLSENEKVNLNLTHQELELIKPYFNTEQFFRYYAIPKNEYWLIYTSSKFKNPNEILPYPNIKKHLDQFQSVITSDNKPYGLHRTRVEDFFIGEKIIVQRKCPNKPIFTYTDFDSYVSATFYVIKTSRLNQKYLTGLLNSTLIAFWLRRKGKMQGNNYQIDKAPLLELPLVMPDGETQDKISNLVAEIILLKLQKPTEDTTTLEAEIDALVYALYGLKEDEIKLIENA